MTAETWRPIPGHPHYEASDQGRIRSIDRIIAQRDGRSRQHRGRVLRPQTAGAGYHHVFLGARVNRYVHRLVLEAFVGPCPDGMEVCHGPGGSTDNRLVNLRWGTHTANVGDTVAAGNKHEQQRTHCPQSHRLAHPNLVAGELPNRKCRACNCARAKQQRNPEIDFYAVADRYYQQFTAEEAS